MAQLLSQLVGNLRKREPKLPRPRPRRSDFIARSTGAVVHEEKLPDSIREMLIRHRRTEASLLRPRRPMLRPAN